MARYNEVEFQCQCPVYNCTKTEIIPWAHYCDVYNSKIYINDDAILRCSECDGSSPFFETRYDCGDHEGEKYTVRFRYPTNLKRVLTIIGALEDDGIYSSDFVDRLSKSLIAQFKRKFGFVK